MIIFLILFLSLFASPAIAADIEVVCPDDPSSNPTSLKCSLTPDNIPLFDEKNIAPGFVSLPRTISVDNLLTSGSDGLILSITGGSPIPIYDGPLIFTGQSLGQIDIGSTRHYLWTVSFPQSAGNDYQSLSTTFDINLNFTCADNSNWQPPVINPTPTTTDSDGTTAGASTTSSSTSSYQCNDPMPGIPSNLTATVLGGGQVKLDWTHANPPYTSYLIAYGFDKDTFLYGNPNIGLSNTYTVSGLTPGAQYCFYVRAQNGCMPGDPSNTVCVGSVAVPIVETTPPAGFQPEILGETTDKSATESGFDLSDIMGAEDQCPTKYIPLLFIIALLLNSLYFYKNPKGNLIFPALTSFSTGLIDWFILRKACCLIPDIFCQYFFVGNIISLFVPKLFFRKTKKNS